MSDRQCLRSFPHARHDWSPNAGPGFTCPGNRLADLLHERPELSTAGAAACRQALAVSAA